MLKESTTFTTDRDRIALGQRSAFLGIEDRGYLACLADAARYLVVLTVPARNALSS